MLIRTFLITWVISFAFFSDAFAAESQLSADSCRALFTGETTSLNRQVFVHLRNSEVSKYGQPEETPHLVLSSTKQLRFYTKNNGERILREENLEDVGAFSRDEVKYLDNIFDGLPLVLLQRSDGLYHVKRWVPDSEVTVDIHTGFIRSDSDVVVRLLDVLVKERSRDEDSALLFLDIDNLGIVNYLPGGHLGPGNQYITEVIRIISANLRLDRRTNVSGKDIGFRLQGGDEYFFILQGVNPEILTRIINRINNAFGSDKNLQAIRRNAYNTYQDFLTRLGELDSFHSMTLEFPTVANYILKTEMWRSLNATEQTAIMSNQEMFRVFIASYISSREAKMKGERILSIPMGATVSGIPIQNGASYHSLHVEADARMQELKTQKKAEAKRRHPHGLITREKDDYHFPDFELQ